MSTDEFGYSPDIGKYVIRGGRMYTENGVIYEENERTMIRSMPYESGSHENYAEWTDEQRARAYDAAKRKFEEHKEAKKVERAARLKLVEQAKAKLTEEEYDAVVEEAQEY